ncbi:respiratory chain complex I subunit 1 family protein [Dactylosporangium sp. NPDC048998]|uniref:respiratory chain complex I subunit 1 family protein n=1 Tax=Dactylosporangium sp. NPDC048998 TaxID=3363976 RepID=UPI003723EFD3
MTTASTVSASIAAAAQVVVVAAGGPLLIGVMRQVRARLEGRAGAGVTQPWRDLRKLLRRAPATPTGTGWAFRLAPLLLTGTSLVLAAVVPLLSTASPLDSIADLFVVVGLLALGTVTLALAALDTGTAFGGMGASREITILALVEPTILVSVFALSARVGSTNLAEIVGATLHAPLTVASPASLLAAAALAIVVVAETGRLPVDNPATHLELTMIHEAMVLEYAGADLALVEWASSMRLTVLLGLLASLFAPWGIAGAGLAGLAALPLALLAFVAKVAVLGAGLGAAEVFIAKLRLFRVPELLAGSFVLALLAVASSFFLA